MALETRHTEKQMLFNLLMALYREPKLKESKEIGYVIMALKAVMEPEDIALVNEQIKALEQQ